MNSSPAGNRSARIARLILTSLLGIEAALAVAGTIPLLLAFGDSGDDLIGQRMSVLLAAGIAVIWVVATFVGALRGRAGWPRGSAITLHVLMFAAGTGMLQYALAPIWMTVGVILLSLVGFFTALMARPELPPEPIEGEAATGSDSE